MESVEAYLKNCGIEPPKLHFDFFLGDHRTEEDGRDIVQESLGSDLIALEWVNWTKAELELFNKISFGGEIPELETSDEIYYASTSFQTGLFKTIQARNIPFIFFDAPNGSDLFKRLNAFMQSFGSYSGSTYSEEIVLFKELCLQFAKLQAEREKYWQESLKVSLKSYLESHAVKDAEQFTLKIFLGRAHVLFYKRFSESNQNTSIAFQYGINVLPYFAEILIALMQDEQVMQQQYEYAYIESSLTAFLPVDTIERSERTQYIKLIASTFSETEKIELYSLKKSDNEESLKDFLRKKLIIS